MFFMRKLSFEISIFILFGFSLENKAIKKKGASCIVNRFPPSQQQHHFSFNFIHNFSSYCPPKLFFNNIGIGWVPSCKQITFLSSFCKHNYDCYCHSSLFSIYLSFRILSPFFVETFSSSSCRTKSQYTKENFLNPNFLMNNLKAD